MWSAVLSCMSLRNLDPASTAPSALSKHPSAKPSRHTADKQPELSPLPEEPIVDICPLPQQPAVEEINRLHADNFDAYRRTQKNAIRIGGLLMDLKQQCGHGNWAAFVEKHLPFDIRTAEVYLRLYKNRDDLKSAEAADLPICKALMIISTAKGKRQKRLPAPRRAGDPAPELLDSEADPASDELPQPLEDEAPTPTVESITSDHQDTEAPRSCAAAVSAEGNHGHEIVPVDSIGDRHQKLEILQPAGSATSPRKPGLVVELEPGIPVTEAELLFTLVDGGKISAPDWPKNAIIPLDTIKSQLQAEERRNRRSRSNCSDEKMAQSRADAFAFAWFLNQIVAGVPDQSRRDSLNAAMGTIGDCL